MAYTSGNKCAKNLCKRIVLLQLIIENVVTCFLEHSVEWCGYPVVRNLWRYVYSFWQNVRTWQTHRHTNRRTPHDDIGRACTASRGKN